MKRTRQVPNIEFLHFYVEVVLKCDVTEERSVVAELD